VVGLVAAGGLAAALSTAAGLLLVISSSIAHDVYARLIDPQASEGRRLLVGRVMIFLAVVVAGFFGIYPPGFVAQVVAFAFGFAAASFFPVILLGIFDGRTNRAGAVSGMVAGLGFTAFYIIGNKYAGMPAFLWGISAEGVGTVGMVVNLIVTFGVSRMTAPPPLHIRRMVEEVRVPRGGTTAEEAAPD
jgi:cation/acetate symporter